jgi:hypothetical protein
MKFLLAVFTGFLLVDIVYLNWTIFFHPKETASVITPASNPTPTPNVDANVCSSGCLSAIQQATKSAQTQIATQSQSAPQPQSGTQEFFVPFGSATITSTTMQTVSGLQAYVNTANYPPITQVLFEASVYVPTGNETVNVQLFNSTAQHPVWYSNVLFNGGATGQLLTSQPITLDPGNNLYVVQMQTQLDFPAVLQQARLHIFTN